MVILPRSNSIGKLLFIAILMFFLTACEEKKLDFDYLIQHPKALKKAWADCQDLYTKKPGEGEKKCDMVKSAVDYFSSLLAEEQNDPEGFGKRIMDEQLKLADLRKRYDASVKILQQLRDQGKDESKLKRAQLILDNDRAAYQKQKKAVNVLLAAVSIISPE